MTTDDKFLCRLSLRCCVWLNARIYADAAFAFYDEEKQEFKIEIPKEQDERKLPMLLRASVSKGIYVLDPKFSMVWVRNRLVPCDRQNIGQFLKSYGLNNYREDLILEPKLYPNYTRKYLKV